MSKLWAGQIAARALKAEGVETMFGLLGGHIQSLMDHSYREGIDVFQMRHEQAAVHAADAYARLKRRPGVCFGTAGPGMLNMLTGIHMAYVSRTPLVCLFGGSKEKEAHRGTMQEAYAAEVCRSITKWTIRVTDPELTGHFIRKAFRDAMTPPYGPVGIEFPIDTFNWEPLEASSQISYHPGAWLSEAAAPTRADPAQIARVAEAVKRAERPLVIAGEGVYWAHAEAELREFVERYELPFNLRRLARGAIEENHRLALAAGARKDILREADLVIVIGLNIGYLEGFGDWKSPARFIQINSYAGDVLPSLPTRFELIGSPKGILTQLGEALASAPERSPARTAWLERVGQAQRKFEALLETEIARTRDDRPIHPRLLGKVVSDFVGADTSIILDSFTSSGYFLDQFRAQRGGQLLDAGLSAAFGHGVGMGIGAQMARPGTPVLAMMGDGGIGLGGGDIETAVRYGQPAVYLIYNDSTYCAGLERYAYGKDFRVLGPKARGGFNLTPDVRYDLMFATLGCHGEHVERPEDIRPALERAFDSGKTAVVNVIGTRDVPHPLYDSLNAKEMFWHLPAGEVEEPARRRHHEGFYPRMHDSPLPE